MFFPIPEFSNTLLHSYGGGGTNLTRTLALPCEAGYFCAGGERKKCGSVALYCTAEASSSTAVPAGHFSTPLTGSPDERTGKAECEAGFYCRGGEKIKCPAGTYGSSKGLSDATCSGKCLEGYYCKEDETGKGSTTSDQHACGEGRSGMSRMEVFCPAGSPSFTVATPGHYTIPETKPSKTCCKTCISGESKACGDTCVALSSTCNTASGCACDFDDDLGIAGTAIDESQVRWGDRSGGVLSPIMCVCMCVRVWCVSS